MNCKEFKDRIVDLFDSDMENQNLLDHIESCDECRKYYEEWIETINVLTPSHAPSLSDDILLKTRHS
jgi:hypothetical protein